MIVARCLVRAFEEAAHRRRHAERLKELPRGRHAVETFRRRGFAEVERRAAKRRDRLERLRVVTDDAEHRAVRGLFGNAEIGVGIRTPEHLDAIRISVRQRLEQDG